MSGEKGSSKAADKAADSKTEEKDVKATKPEPTRPQTPLELLYKNVDRLQKAASHHDSAAITRLLKTTTTVRHHLPLTKFAAAVEAVVSNTEDRARIISLITRAATLEAPGDIAMDAASESKTDLVPPEAGPPSINPAAAAEVSAYLTYLALSLLVKRGVWEEVSVAARYNVERITALNRRSLDVFGAKFWSFTSLAAERLGRLATIRTALHDAHRTACLRHDEIGQATLLNLLVRNYLAFNLYDQAAKLISKATFPEGISNNQFIRFLYYKGRIEAVQLDYSDALGTLTHADRKSPAGIAKGFRAQVKKFLIVVQLLLGEIPERSVFELEDLKRTLQPYLAVTQAVRVGDLAEFNAVVAANEALFKSDMTFTLIQRLRQNVIKAGLRKIWMSYSRISFVDIAHKLHLESAEDAEFLCAKAIRDGVLEAQLNHEGGYLSSKDVLDVYSTTDPQSAFDRRIKFCLDVHNDAVKSMSYPAPEVKDTTAVLEREKEENALAEEVEDLEDMEDDGDL